MSVYYSPHGNPEIWDKKPKNYLTLEEWAALNPPPAPLPLTPAEQAQARTLEIKMELANLDQAAARPAQEILDESTSQDDLAFAKKRLADINRRKAELRAELAGLTQP